ncbi:YadA-like family protein [Bartonella sp. 1-1C]|uniref:YadA-like family protein n=1 Tax=Bartonella sp. 1-1C TaxID=515256 RepID=UPI000C058482|nr:YadA-like family protein [Bartonella sp. 1-1C]ATO56955.1 Head domain of trimeric autotransporter adhesin [Bartonella sp. 1-1C]
MKRSRVISKESVLNDYHFSRRSPLLKAASLGTAMAALLSSVAPVVASTLTEQQTTIQSLQSPKGKGMISLKAPDKASKDSRGSSFAGGRYCGIDNVVLSNSSDSRKIISEENYVNLVTHYQFDNWCSRDFGVRQATWTVDGRNTVFDVLETLRDDGSAGPGFEETPIKIGYLARAELNGIAIGNNAGATSKSVALGSFAANIESLSVAVGYSARSGPFSVAVGANALAEKKGVVALGSSAGGSEEFAIAIGEMAKARSEQSIALGFRGKAFGDSSIAIGWDAETGSDYSIALGLKGMAFGESSIAIGKEAKTGSDFNPKIGFDYSIALGFRGKAFGAGSIAIGQEAETGSDYSIALGAGAKAKGGVTEHVVAIAIGQDALAEDRYSIALGVGARTMENPSADHMGSIAIGKDAFTKGGLGIALGVGASSGYGAIAIGKDTSAKDDYSITLGYEAETSGRDSVVIGHDAKAKEEYSVAIGKSSKVEGKLSVVLGDNATVLGVDNSAAIGAYSGVHVENSVALGYYSKVKERTVIGGYDPRTNKNSTDDSYIWKFNYGIVSIADPSGKRSRLLTGVAAGIEDSDAVNVAQLKALREWVEGGGDSLVHQEASEDESGRITIGSKVGGTAVDLSNKDREGRTLSGLKDGTLSGSSTEAVTGKQLYAVDSQLTETTQKVTDVSTSVTKVQGDVSTIAKNATAYLGGGADILGGKAPTYKVQGKDHHDIGSAFVGVDGSITDIYSKIAGVAEGNDLIHQEADEQGNGRITIGSKVGGTAVDLSNKDREGRILSGLKDGTLSESSTEAVTGKQLYAVDSQLTETTQKVTDVSTSVTKVQGDISTIAQNASAYLGGGSDVLGGEAPTYKVQGTEHHDVGSAFVGVDGSITDIYSKIAGVAEGNDLIHQEADEQGNGRITIGSKVGGTAVDLSNKDREGRILSGLKDGTLSESSTEAVTGKQLYAVDSQLTETTQKVTDVSTSVTKVQGDISTIAQNASAYLGGGSDVLGGEAPTYKVQGTEHHDVGSAFVGVDGSITDIYSKIAGVAEGNDLIHQEADEQGNGRITIGSKVGGTAVDLSNKDREGRTLSGLKDGTLSESSTEAVTGKQLYAVDSQLTETTQKVTDVSTSVTKVQGDISTIAQNASAYLGGGSDVLGGEAPTYKVQGTEHHDVGSAFVGVDGSITDIYSKIAGVAEGNDLIHQEADEQGNGRITIGSKVGGTAVDLSNKDREGRTLSGLKDGTLSESSTEAVTGKQLYAVDSQLTETTQKVTDVSTSVTKVQGDISTIAQNASAYLGGGSDVLGGEAPTYKVQGTEHHDVGSAFVGVDGSITDIYSKIAGVAEGNDLIHQEADEQGNGRITIGSKVGGTAVDLSNKDREGRILSGLKDGTLSESSTEAVTGKQLYAVDSQLTETTQKVTDVSTSVTKVQGDISTIAQNASAYLGGGSDVLGGEAPTYKVQGTEHHDVGSAFAGVDGSISDLYSQIANVEGGGDSLVQQEKEESGNGRITIGSKVGGTAVDLSNKDREGRTLSGLKDGTLSESSTEAVTGKQLYAVDSQLTETTQKVTDVSTSVTKVQGDISTIAQNASAYLGGGSDVLGGEAPTYKVQGTEHHDVGSAFVGVDGSITDIYSKIAGVAEGNDLIHQEADEQGNGRITIGSKVGGTAVDLSNKDREGRILSGLKDGTLSESSTEAVTGKQLYAVDSQLTETTQKVTDVSTSVTKVQGDISTIAKNASAYLGGGSDVLGGEAPTYKVQGTEHHDVGSAFAGVDGSITDIYSKIAGVAEGNDLIHQEADEQGNGRITIGSKVGGTAVDLSNKDREGRTLSGLKDGTLSESSTEAVTGKQLYAVDSQLTETTQKVTDVSTSVTKVQGDISTIAQNATAYLGGGSDVLGGEAPTYKVQGTEHHDVGSAFVGVDGSITDIYSKIAGVAEGNDLIHQEADEQGNGRITIGSKVGGTAVDLSNKDREGRILSGLKDGALSESSTEAVTGKQLYAVDNQLTETTEKVAKVQGDISTIAQNASAYLGGGSDVLGGEAPTYKVQGTEHHDVGSAFAGVDGSISDLYSQIANVEGGGDSLVQQEKEESGNGRITIGSKVGGTEINLSNKDREGRILSGLKDGTLSESSTEAVTGKQLYAVDNQLTETTEKVTKVQGDISTIAQNASAYLGGGSDVLGGEAPTYKVQGTEHHDVGSAFAGVDGSISDLYSQIANVEGGGDSLVQQEKEESGNGRITIGSKVGGTEINLSNKDREGRILSGLKDGALSESSTEAVTGKQLYAVDNQLTETTEKVAKVQGDISTIAQNASAYLGGGSDVLGGEAPTYKVQGTEHHDVGSAFAGVDGSISDLYSQIANVEGGGDSLVQQEKEESGNGRITIGSKVGGTEINLSNKDREGRILSGLKDGTLSESSTEAVTGKQLYAVDNQLTETTEKVTKVQGDISTIAQNASAYLGGGSDVLGGEAPTYKVQGTEHHDVGSAFAGVDGSISDLYSQIANVEGGGDSLVQQEKEESGNGRITIGSKVGGTEINLSNKDREGRILSGLKDGTLSESSTEAVTGKQLYAVDSQLTETTQKVTDVSTSVTKVQGDISTIAKNASAYLGGGSDVLGGEAPTYKVQGTEHHDVGSAFVGVDGSITDIYSKIAGVAEGNDLIHQEADEQGNGRITIGSKVGGTAVDLSNKDREGRTLSGLKDGTLSESSTEAVTGKQLYAVDSQLTETTQKVTDVSTSVTKVQGDISTIAQNASAYLGGGSDVLGGEAPTYKVQGTEHHDVGSAFAGVDGSISDLYSQIANVEGGGDSLVQQEKEESGNGRITIGSKVGGTEINLSNKDREGRILSGLKDGTLSESSTEAVTGKQLYAVDNQLTETTEKVTKVQGDISTIAKNATAYLGGGSDVLVGIAPTYKVQGTEHHDVGSAFAGVDGSISDLYSQIANVEGGGDSLVQQEKEESGNGRITIGSKVGGTEINLSNKDREGRILSGLKDGTLSESSTEAVTGKQLYAVDNQLTETTEKVTKVQGDISTIAKNATAYLGGGSDVLVGIAPTYKVQGTEHHDVGSAFVDVDGSISDLYSQIANVEGGGDSLVQQEKEESGNGRITIGSKVGGTEINLSNKDREGRILSGLKDGALSESSTEAVTGKQLYAVDNQLTETTEKVTKVQGDISTIAKNATAYLGGGSDVLVGIAPTYKVQGTEHHDVGSAFAGVDGSISDLYSQIANVEGGGDSLVQQEKEESGNGRITIGSKVGGTEINLSNKDREGRILSGLKDGTLSESSTEAVTGKQLYAVDNQLTETTEKVTKVQGDISTIAQNATAYLGGGSDVLVGIAPTYKVQGTEHHDVGSAFVDVDGSISDLYSQIANVEGGGDSLVQQEKEESGNGRITIGSKVGGTEINLSNKDREGRILSGLKDGALSESSTEAVTGKQLYAVDNQLTETTEKVTKVQGDISTIAKNATAYLGGGSDVLVGIAPTYKVQGTEHHDVGSAFAGVDGSISDLYSQIANVEGGGDSLVQQEKEESGNGRITIGSKVGGTEINLSNKDREGRILSGLKDGTLSESSTEAVTGKQLYAVDNQLTETTEKVTKVQGDISTIAQNATAYLGGGSDVLVGIAPTYKVQGTEHHDVGSAFVDVDGSISDLYSQIANVEGGGDSLVQQEKEESGNGRITIGSKVGGTEINLSNKDREGRILSGLKDGTLSESSTEAVTGKQLYAVDNQLTETTEKVTKVQGDISTIAKNATAYLGGGSDVLVGIAPTYKVQGTEHHDVGSAFAGVDGSISDLYSQIANVEGGGDSLVQQEKEESGNGRITIGSKVGGTEINLSNKDREGRILSGLKDGTLSESSTEAVTGKQLYAVDNQLTETTEKVTKVQGDISTIAKNATAYLGGGSDVLVGIAPTYKVQGTEHHDVGSAFVDVDGSISDLYSQIANVEGGGDSLVQQEKEESGNGRITIGSKVGGTEINLSNKDREGRILSGLKDGALSESSTEAVTGKQLYAVDNQLTETTEKVTKVQGDISTIAKNATAYLGGGSDVLVGIAPTYKVQGTEHHDVGSAFAGVDGSISDLYSQIANVEGGGDSLVQQEKEESGNGRITIGSKVGGTEINLSNKDREGRILSGLKDGTLSESSTEAVTGKQLYAVDNQLTETTEKVTKVQGDISTIAQNATAYLGGGSDVLVGIAPTYKVQGTEHHDVGSAFVDVDGSISDLYSQIANVEGGGDSLVQQEKEESGNGRITIGSKVGGTEINLSNKDREGRILSGLKDGTLSESSTEAVTGKQLYAVDSQLTETTQTVEGLSMSMDKVEGDISTIAQNATAYLGGGSDVLVGIAPTYKVQGTEHHDVGSAFAGVDGSISDLYSQIANVEGGGDSLVQQEKEESGNGRITIGSKVGGTEINLSNKDREGRILSGLKDGTLSESSTEAVTGKQLYAVDNQLTETTEKVTKVQGDISTIAQNASAYLGGGSNVLGGEAPTYKVQGTEHHDVGSAFAGVDGSISDLYSQIANVEGGGDSLVQQEKEESGNGRITIGSKVGGTEINLSNKDREGRILSGLKDGALSESSTEAVTGKQLYAVDNQLTETTQTVEGLSMSMDKVEGDISTIAQNASAYLGGGSNVLGGEAPTYKVQGTEHHDVGSAFAGVDGSISDLYSQIANVEGGGDNLVQQEKEESGNGRITIGSKVGGTEINLSNKDREGRILSGLKDGALSESSTEAVTGKQLYAVDNQLTETTEKVTKVQGDISTIAQNATAYLGGGSDVLGGEAPTYKVQGTEHHDVGSAFAGVDGSISDLYSQIANVEGGGDSLVQQEKEESGNGRITIGSKVGGTEINLSNKDREGRILSGLKDGTLSESSTEAVTGKQLYAVDNQLTETTEKVTKVQGDISTIAQNASAYLGGGSNVLGGEAPTYKVQGTEHHDVGSAFAGVDGSISDLYSQIANVEGGGDSLVQQEKEESGNGRITIGSKVGGTEINLSNKDREGRILSGLKDGALSESSTEAVTGKQLYAVDNQLTETTQTVEGLSMSMDKVEGDISTIAQNASAYLGGGSDVLGGEAPTYKVQGTEHHDVGSAFAGVDGSISDLYSQIANVEGGGDSLVQQEKEESGNGRITIGSKVGGTEINLSNKDREGRILSGLKDGALSESSTEAVTGKQLYAVDNQLTETTQTVEGLSMSMDKVEGDISTIAQNASAYLGGGSNVLGGEAPTYKVQGTEHHDVGSAFAGVDGSISDLYSQIANVEGGGDNLVQQEKEESGNGRITIGSKVGGTEINLSNKDREGRILSGLKDGALSESSTEAVTGKQLYAVDNQLTETTEKVTKVQGDISTIAQNATAYLGGGSDVLGGEAPTYKVQGTEHHDVGSAFAGVDGSISDLYSQIANVEGGGDSLVQQEKEESGNGRITIGSKVGGTEINLSNKDREGRILSGLKDGTLSESSTEAVTGKQLYAVDNQLTETTEKVAKVQGDISTIAKNATAYLGGGSDVLVGIAPTYKVQGTEHHDVGSAFVDVDGSISDLYSQIANVEGGGDSLVQQEKEESGNGRITIGSKVGGTEINLSNKDREGRILSGLKDGALSESSTEAVTGKQLYAVDNQLTETTQTVEGLSMSMDKVEGDISTIAQNASAYLGGGSNVLGGEAPTYKVQGTEHHDVGSAFVDVDGSISDLYSQIANVEGGGDSLVQQEKEESGNGRITIGSKVGGTEINLSNKDREGRILSGLKDGALSESSTEAVTGKQLYAVDNQLTETTQTVEGLSMSMDKVEGDISTIAQNASAYLGGGSNVLGGEAPTYKVQGTEHHDVGSAFAGVDGSISDLYSQIANVEGGGDSLVQQEKEESGNGRITIGSKVGGTEINLSNKDREGRILSGLKDGTLSESSTEAVTGKQLYAVDNQLTETTQTVEGLSMSMDKVEGDISTIAQNASAYLGGGSNVLGGEAPTYKVQGTEHHDVGSAFAGVDGSISDLYSQIANVEGGGDNLVQQEKEESGNGRITIGSKVGGTEINLSNKDREGRILSGLKDGALSESSTEAVTGKQLYAVDNQLTETTEKVTKVQGDISTIAQNASAYLGGGSDVLGGEAPTYKVQGTEHHDVGSAFAGVDGSISDLYSQIANVEGGGDSLVQQEKEESGNGRITIGSKVGGTEINLSNKDREGRILSGLKDGTLSESSTEAVTGKQLYAVDNQLTETTEKVTKVQGDISTIAQNASAYLGGGSNVLGGEAPTYKVQGTEHHDVGSAFAGVDGSISDLYSQIANVEGGGDSLVQQEKEESGNGRITIGSKVGGTEINLSNKDREGRILSGLKDGALSESSTEAVTGKQLYAVDNQLTETTEKVTKVQGDISTIAQNATAYLGGGSDVLVGIAPTYKVQGTEHHDVGSAFAGVDGSISDLYSQIANVEGGGDSLVQQEKEESGNGRITIGSKVGGTEINLSNKDREGRILSGLKDGTLSESSTEAVTGKQLYAVDNQLTETTEKVTKVQGDISTIAKNATAYLGGGSDVLVGIAPTYKVQGTEHHDVGSAFVDVDGSISDLYSQIANVEGGGDSLVQQEKEESGNGRITIGSKVGGTEINLSNKDREGRILSGLKDGTLSESSTEAVTGKQLYAVDNQLTETTEKVTKVQGDISTIAKNATAYLGGGSDVLVGIAPTYKVQGTEHHDVGSAFVDVDGSISDLYSQIANVEGGGDSLVQQEKEESGNGRITIGSKVGGTEINLSNKDREGRILSGLKDGTLSESSTEAVTGKQLYAVDNQLTETTEKVTKVQGDVSTIAKNATAYLGGGSDVLGGEAPTYKVQGTEHHDVGSAFAGVDGSISDLYSQIANVEGGGDSLVQQEKEESGNGRITIGSKVGGTEINLSNKDREGRILSGLKDGTLSESSTEAVTGKQLYAVDSQLTETTQTVEGLSMSMDKVEGDISTIAQNASAYLGGGSNVLVGIAPTYKVQGTEHHDVGSAFVDVDGSISDLYSQIANVEGGGDSLVQQEKEESGNGRITIGSKVGGTEINLSNKDREGRILSGLKDGALSESSTEAVTGKQLYAVDNQLTETTQTVEGLSMSMDKVEGDISTIAQNASAYLGGGSNVLGGEAPTYKVQGTEHHDVGSAFAGVDGSISDLYSQIANVEGGGDSLVQQEKEESGNGRITIGSKVGGTEINLSNKDREGRILSGLKDGTLSESSTEAVTGKQLYAVDSQLTETTQTVEGLSMSMDKVEGDISTIAQNASAYLGGGSNVLGGEAPTYKVQGTEHHDVGSAFAGVDGSISDLYSQIANVEGGGDSLVQQEKEESGNGRITIGSKVGGTEINLSNKDREGRILSGLKDGALSESSTEAVTGKQLYAVDNQLTETTQTVEGLSMSMDKVEGDISTIAQNASAYLGGGSNVLGGEAPTYKVQGTEHHDVGSAFAGVDGSISDLYSQIANVEGGGDNLVQQEKEESGNGRITIGSKVGGTEINLSNKDREGRILSGLKDGALSESSTEAVTGKQLYAVDNQLTETTQTVEGLSMSMDKVEGDISTIAQNASAYLGGGSNVLGGIAPTYTVQGNDYNNVGEAFSGVDTTLTKIQQEMTENTESAAQNSLLWSDSEQAFVARHGEKGQEKTNSKLKFLLDGEIAEGSTEAITGAQLYETNTKLADYLGGGAGYKDGVWTTPTFNIIQFNFGDKADGLGYQSYNSVADAFGGVNKSLGDLNNRLGNVENQTENDVIKWNDEKKAYDANHNGKEAKITGVADGKVEKGSSEAVTGNQLWETNQRVEDLENKFDKTTAQMTEGAVQYDKDKDGKKTNKVTLSGGDTSAPVVIDNVGDGKVEKGSKEAINGGQLYEKMAVVLDDSKKYTDEKIQEAKDYTDMKFESLNYNIEGVKKEARQAAAIGLAAANLRYNEMPGKLSIAIGSGLWRNQSAFAFGAGYTSENGNIRSNISVTNSGNNWGIGGGIQFTLN